MILGGFNPLINMGKDIADTFKPYKSNFHVVRDLTQPIRGIGNIIKGAFEVAASPLLFLGNTVRYAAISEDSKVFGYNMKINAARTLGGLLSGVTNTIRGISQVITTPLNWLVKMPLRGLITAIKGKPKIEDSQKRKFLAVDNIEQMVTKGATNILSVIQNMSNVEHLPFLQYAVGNMWEEKYHARDAMSLEIHRKVVKGVLRGQPTDMKFDSHSVQADLHRCTDLQDLASWKLKDFKHNQEQFKDSRRLAADGPASFFRTLIPAAKSEEWTNTVTRNINHN